MSLNFTKYHGTGNDFILIDGYTSAIDLSMFTKNLVKSMCDRRFGIGADGLMILKQSDNADFEMIYYNSDGSESSMCGNGGRCVVAFAKQLGVIQNSTSFKAVDGLHDATIDDGIVNLSMNDVSIIEKRDKNVYILDTGSPHYVQFKQGIDSIDLVKEAKSIRFNEEFKEHGINVNYVEQVEENWKIRTYERGVEAETYSCGTGVTAAALSIAEQIDLDGHCALVTKGGLLTVAFKKLKHGYSNIMLSGPTTHVYDGEYMV